MLKWCVLVGLDWAEPMIFLLLHVTCSYIFHAYAPFYLFIYIYIYIYIYFIDIKCVGTFLFVPFSLSFFRFVALWHLNGSLLRLGTLFVSGHLLLLLLLILLHPMSSSMMIKPIRTFHRIFHDATFIQNAKLFYRIFPILTFPLSSTVGVGSHYVASRSLVPLWSYKSFSPIFMDSTILYLILSLAFEVRAL